MRTSLACENHDTLVWVENRSISRSESAHIVINLNGVRRSMESESRSDQRRAQERVTG